MELYFGYYRYERNYKEGNSRPQQVTSKEVHDSGNNYCGNQNQNSFIRIIIIRPTMTRAISKGMFNQLRFKLLRIEYITAINIAKFMS